MKASLLFFVALSPYFLFCQNFVNGDLEGSISATTPPPGWQNVSYSAPYSQATSIPHATSDVCDISGPSLNAGVAGIPQSGNTFVSGLYSGDIITYNNMWHEGIYQQVSGFTPGCKYTVTFWQSVVKQHSVNNYDSTGSWSVYSNNTLVGTSEPTYSDLVYSDLNLIWEKRQIHFVANDPTVTLSFLPEDDDTIHFSVGPMYGGLRMGIDNISLAPFTDFLGKDTTLCYQQDTLVLTPDVPSGSFLWGDGSTGATLNVTESGYYSVQVSGICGTFTDSIYVKFDTITTPALGMDLILCENDSLELNGVSTDVEYLWSTNSTNPSITIHNPGTYWLQYSNACGLTHDTIKVLESSIPNATLGDDVNLCEGDSITFALDIPFTSYLWNIGSSDSSISTTLAGNYWVNATNSCGTDSDTVLVSITSPNATVTANEFVLSTSIFDSYQWVNCATNYSIIPGQIYQLFNAPEEGSYAIVVTQDGCIDTSTCIIISSAQLTEDYSGISINHNSMDNTLHVNGDAYLFGQGVSLMIYSNNGSIVEKIETSEAITIDLSSYSKGVYFIQLLNIGEGIIQKIVIF